MCGASRVGVVSGWDAVGDQPNPNVEWREEIFLRSFWRNVFNTERIRTATRCSVCYGHGGFFEAHGNRRTGDTQERLFRLRGRPHILITGFFSSVTPGRPQTTHRPEPPAQFHASKNNHLTQRGFVMCGLGAYCLG